eukprot:gene5721-7306_t
MYDKGPFIDVSPSASQIAFAIDSSMSSYVPAHPQRALSSQWESFEFSADGSNILVRTKSDMILVLDAFESSTQPIAIFSKKAPLSPPGSQGACFTKDCKYVLACSEDGDIHTFDKNSGTRLQTVTGHTNSSTNVCCNPRYPIIASTCTSTILWVNRPQEQRQQEDVDEGW